MALAPPETQALTERFQQTSYLVRKKIFSLLGATFHIYDPAGNLAFYSKMKAFKLKEDIRLYTDESMTTEVFMIKARNIIDFSAAYDVFDSVTQEKVGALQRRGFKSMFKDEWNILDPQDQPVGVIYEDSLLWALLRRFFCNLIPQHYAAKMGETPVATYRQNFNPFVTKIVVDFSDDPQYRFNRRLALAAALLLCAIEGKQD